jgi:hypothetical protein
MAAFRAAFAHLQAGRLVGDTSQIVPVDALYVTWFLVRRGLPQQGHFGFSIVDPKAMQ